RRAAASTPPATGSTHEIAEDILEDIGHGGGKFRPETRTGARPAILEGGMAEPVIGRALLRVLERVIGLVDFLELVFGLFIARIAIRVKLHGELAIRALEGCVVGALL